MGEPQHSQEDLDFLTVEEVARQLRVSPKTVRAWLVHGWMHGFKLTPKVWRIRREDFQAFVTVAERQADESMDRSERSMVAQQDVETLAGQYLARIMDLQSNYFDLFLKEELAHLVQRVVEKRVERLAERFFDQRTAQGERSMERSTPAITDHKAAVLTRL